MFDSPVYKLLSPNDTGGARGHQAGIVIPADIADFFPDVEGTITPATPTADVSVVADLFVDGRFVGMVETRYQFQTWGGQRSPERRLTGGLGPLRNHANPDDIVLFSRDPEIPDRMMITLVRQGDDAYDSIVSSNPQRRWGIVAGLPKPVSNSEIRSATEDIEALTAGDFQMFDDRRSIIETPIRKKARNAAFRKTLLEAYGPRCMGSGELIDTPNGLVNLDAAHIIPVEAGGSDDVRNGLLLSKDLHWAFDKGLFSITAEYKVIISSHIANSTHGEAIKRISNSEMVFDGAILRPHDKAIQWHLENRFLG
jgi:putative restriction endonuclease